MINAAIAADQDLPPTSCLAQEPEEARSLRWVPLAVRYKLDRCSLHISLDQWHMLPLDVRSALVSLPLGEGGWFEQLALSAGACMRRVDRSPPATFSEYVHQKLQVAEAAAMAAR